VSAEKRYPQIGLDGINAGSRTKGRCLMARRAVACRAEDAVSLGGVPLRAVVNPEEKPRGAHYDDQGSDCRGKFVFASVRGLAKFSQTSGSRIFLHAKKCSSLGFRRAT